MDALVLGVQHSSQILQLQQDCLQIARSGHPSPNACRNDLRVRPFGGRPSTKLAECSTFTRILLVETNFELDCRVSLEDARTAQRVAKFPRNHLGSRVGQQELASSNRSISFKYNLFFQSSYRLVGTSHPQKSEPNSPTAASRTEDRS